MSNRDIGYLIKNINDKLKAKADADLKQYNLTLTQSRVFAFLNSRGGQATQKEIEVFLDVSHPTVTGIVSRMEHNGYVTCRIDDDKRNKLVSLTDRARALGLDMEQHMREDDQKLLSPLSAEDAERLKEMLWIIYKNME